MKNTKNNFPIGELNNSASPNKAVPNEKDLNIYNRKKALIKMGVIGALLIVMIIFGTISWFTQNRQVESSGMTIKTATLPFDIATKGASVRNQSEINAKRPEYVEGSSGTYSNLSGTSDTYYTDDSLLLRYTPVADDPATDDFDESETPDISPGSNGELSLYVIPKTDSSLKVKVSLNVVAFAEIDKYDVTIVTDEQTQEDKEVYTKTGTQIIEITNAEDFADAAYDAGNSDAADEAAKYVAASDYLKGHILFFGGQGNTSSGAESSWYYYTTPYTSGTITQTIVAGNEGKAVQVPIYWMWANTLGQIALANNSSNQRSGIPVVRDLTSAQINTMPNTPLTDKEKLITYVKENKDIVLMDWQNIELSVAEESAVPEIMIAQQVTQEKAWDIFFNGLIDDFDDANNFSRLSKCYNAADNEIGTRIRYFMIEVTVESDS